MQLHFSFMQLLNRNITEKKSIINQSNYSKQFLGEKTVKRV